MGQIGSQSSTESERSDKENNEVRGLPNLLRNNRQTTPPPSSTSPANAATTTTTTTATTTTATTTSRFSRDVKPKNPDNETSAYGFSPSPASGANTRPGGVRRNLDLFENRSSASPERSSATGRQSASPVERTRTSLTPERQRLSLARDSPRPSPLQERTWQAPVQETPVSKSLVQPSQATPGFSKDRYGRDSSTYSSQTDLSKGDFRSVLGNRQRSFDKNGNNKLSAQTSADTKPSWARKDPATEEKKNGHGRDAKAVPSIGTDFRSVLKNRQAGSETKPSGVTKDSKANVQSKTDFRSVLSKIKKSGDEKNNGPSNSGGAKVSSEKPLNRALAKDVSSIKSKFETPARDFRSVQLKPSKPPTTVDQSPSVRTDTDSTRKPADWRTTARSRDTTTTPKTTTTTTTTTTTSFTTGAKQPDVSSSLGKDSSRFSEAPKDSDSSQWSDSAISSAFSKLSEFSDLSDSNSPRSEVEVEVPVEPRSRRRFERLRGEGGGGGGGGAKKAEDPSEAPNIQRRLENQRVTYGGQAVFQCRIFGVPQPDINWSLNDKTIKVSCCLA